MSNKVLTSKLKKENILTKLNCKSRDEAIGLMADLLTEHGVVKPSFKGAVIERESNFATGLDVGSICVAIPHTDREHVIKDAIGIATLNTPVTFMAMGTDNDPVNVRIIIMLAIASNDKQIDTLQQVIELIQDSSVLEGIINAENPEKLLSVLM